MSLELPGEQTDVPGDMRVSKELALRLAAQAPRVTEPYDTTSEAFADHIALVERTVQAEGSSLAALDETLRHVASRDSTVPILATRTAIKILEGRHNADWINAFLEQQDKALTITLLQPVYHETPRMSARTPENPSGEDALTYKLWALDQLQRRCPRVHFRVLVIDDGCDGWGQEDRRSGVAAQVLIDTWKHAHPNSSITIKVLFLADAIAAKSPYIPPGLMSTRDSVKGGSVLFGMAYVTQEWTVPNQQLHVVVDSDADLSVHPDQIPSLIRPILEEGVSITAGSRRAVESVSLIGKARNSRGTLFIDVWQQLLPDLAKHITDTNRGFKAVAAEAVPTLLSGVKNYKFPYQIEVLLVGVQARKGGVRSVPVAYIDSEALSTQEGDTAQSYLDQVVILLDMAKRHKQRYNKQLAAVIEQLQAKGDEGEAVWLEAEKSCSSVAELLALQILR